MLIMKFSKNLIFKDFIEWILFITWNSILGGNESSIEIKLIQKIIEDTFWGCIVFEELDATDVSI